MTVNVQEETEVDLYSDSRLAMQAVCAVKYKELTTLRIGKNIQQLKAKEISVQLL